MSRHDEPTGGTRGGTYGGGVRAGLVYAHERENANTVELEDIVARLVGLVGLLVERGVLDADEVERARTRAAAAVRDRMVEQGNVIIHRQFKVSKHEFADIPQIDCDKRVHLCRAACCRLQVGLSIEDVEEGILRWHTFHPYALAKTPDGYCVHMDEETCGCTVYTHRPIPCRAFDCSGDMRIWLDFEARIPNPRLHDPDWPDCLKDRGDD
jgi:hypothetical protein